MSLFFSDRAFAQGWICPNGNRCETKGFFTKSSAGPSKGDKIRLNPAAVPTEKITGLEAIYFGGEFDFALVKGLGRVGAAISPSNSEETFFGPIGYEQYNTLEVRAEAKKKYKGDKFTLATGFNLFEYKAGVRSVSVDLGVMGKYNKATKAVTPGGGLNLSLGPFIFGYGYYRDQTKVEADNGEPPSIALPGGRAPTVGYLVDYNVDTMSAGFTLQSFSLDYSLMRAVPTAVSSIDQTITVRLVTGSLFLGRSIISISQRTETSQRLVYDFDQAMLSAVTGKTQLFGGFQYRIGNWLMAGVYYNYYLLREASVGASVFF